MILWLQGRSVLWFGAGPPIPVVPGGYVQAVAAWQYAITVVPGPGTV